MLFLINECKQHSPSTFFFQSAQLVSAKRIWHICQILSHSNCCTSLSHRLESYQINCIRAQDHMLHQADHHATQVDLVNCIRAMDPEDIWMESGPNSLGLFP